MEPEFVSRTTRLLQRMGAGDGQASEELFSMLYEKLRDMARGIAGPGARGSTLQPTALVHEVWIRLNANGSLTLESRRHFLRTAARAMRGVVVDHLRARGAGKRSAGRERVPLDDVVEAWEADGTLHPLALDEYLERLREHDKRLADVVDLRFFGGLTEDEVAETLELTARQVQHAWRLARAWLAREMQRGSEARPK
jgi:RNA polymerase sigma factor (TIGR02999 family)